MQALKESNLLSVEQTFAQVEDVKKQNKEKENKNEGKKITWACPKNY
jgi:hypothetical protein